MSLFSLRYSIIAVIPPLSTNILESSGDCLVTYLMTVAAIFLTPSSMSLSLYNILGKSSEAVTVYANSAECLAILAKVWQTCFLS